MPRSIFFYTDSHDVGGAEHALFMLLANVDRARWRLTLLLDEHPGADALAQLAADARVDDVRRIAPMPQGLTGATRALRIVRLLRSERPDVFHAHLTWPFAAKWMLAAAAAARVPAIVATVQLVPHFEPDRSNKLQLRLLSTRVGRYIAVSRDIAERLSTDFGWPSRKMLVILNAVDLERFDTAPDPRVRAALTGGLERKVVLTCARLEEQKGHSVLLRAAAELPDVIFVLAGGGSLRHSLETEAARLGVADRVRFLGRRSDIPELLTACDVFALPSLYEGSSLAILEAMAARRPVVSSSIGGTDEVISDGETGLLVEPGDGGKLAAALQRILEDDTLRREITEQARRHVEQHHSPSANAKLVERIYEDLLLRGPSRRVRRQRGSRSGC